MNADEDPRHDGSDIDAETDRVDDPFNTEVRCGVRPLLWHGAAFFYVNE